MYWITVALLLEQGQCEKVGRLMQSSVEEYWVGISKGALQHFILRSGSASITTCHCYITTRNVLVYQKVTITSVDRTVAEVFIFIRQHNKLIFLSI